MPLDAGTQSQTHAVPDSRLPRNLRGNSAKPPHAHALRHAAHPAFVRGTDWHPSPPRKPCGAPGTLATACIPSLITAAARLMP
ncbi:hypothetical protein VTO73DRAFT_15452 [Trametes versicolor]